MQYVAFDTPGPPLFGRDRAGGVDPFPVDFPDTATQTLFLFRPLGGGSLASALEAMHGAAASSSGIGVLVGQGLAIKENVSPTTTGSAPTVSGQAACISSPSGVPVE